MKILKRIFHKHDYFLTEEIYQGVGTSTFYYAKCECGKKILLRANELTCFLANKNLQKYEEDIHVTVGVYNNLGCSVKSNGVKSAHLAEHIKYNLDARPGRAFFVDGVCLNNGYLSDEEIKLVQCRVNSVKHIECTVPYV